MTVDRMDKYIAAHKKTVLPRMDNLDKRYMPSDEKSVTVDPQSGRRDILLRHSYAAYITDINVGYFMGEAIKYSAGDDERANTLLERLSGIFAYTDEMNANAELAEDASIYGIAQELLYMDGDAKIRFKAVDPREIILVYDNTVENALLYAIRTYKDKDILQDKETEYADLYDATTITSYTRQSGGSWVQIGEPTPHHFRQVPINSYLNNRRAIGDFEQILSLIDAYDRSQSNAVSELEDFRNAYLKLLGMEDTDETDVKEMRKNRVLNLPEGGDASWLVKPQDDTALEHLRDRLDKDIHKLSMTPALTDESFAGDASGIALKFKLQGLENKASRKERGFRLGLQRRMELICEVLAVLDGVKYDYTQIGMTFTRNIPSNLLELVDVAVKASGLVSDETAIGILPLDIDAKAEIEKKRAEAEAGYTLPMWGAQ